MDWEGRRLHVTDRKRSRPEQVVKRVVPLFPELEPILQEAFAEVEEGARFVIGHRRQELGSDESLMRLNLGQQMTRIIRRAGLDPWPKTFQNLRSTWETELAEDFPLHVVCNWIGNSELVATKHYLQTTDAHFERAVRLPAPALL